MNTTTINLTSNTKEAINLLAKIALSNKKNNEAFPTAIKLDEKGMMYAASQMITVNYKLSTEELGIAPQLLEKPVLISEKAISILQNLEANTEITISEDNNQLVIKHGKGRGGKITVASMDVEKFPHIEGIEVDKTDRINCDDLLAAVRATSHAMSSNKAKPLYTGLHFISDTNNLTVFACDSFSSAIYQVPYKSDEFTLSIPPECINLLMAAISKKDGESKVSVVRAKSNRFAAFVVDKQTVIRTRLLEGILLDYKQFFGEQPNVVKLKKNDILRIMKNINLLSDNASTPAVLHFSTAEKCIEISYKGVATECFDVLPAEYIKGDGDIYMGMNNIYLSDAVKAISGDEICIHFDGPVRPIKITSSVQSDKKTECVCVPMRISKE